MDVSIMPPSLRGEIKKARASNYSWDRVINEFIDNALDALSKSKQKVKQNLIMLGQDTNEDLKSIKISDNNESGIKDPNIWNWTYERDRDDLDCGEFGTGFKSGSVNISSELTCFTKSDGKHTKMKADWDEMAEENTYTPEIKDIDEEHYHTHHPFEYGSTFIMKHLIKTNIPTDYNHTKQVLINKIKNAYKKKLRENHDMSIIIDDKNPGEAITINHENIPNEIHSKKIRKHEKIPYSEIYVYKNKKNELTPIVKHESSYFKINFKDSTNRRGKNGNISICDMRGWTNGGEIVNKESYDNKDEYTLLDTLEIRSRCIYHLTAKSVVNDIELPHPNGNITLIRKDRTLSDRFTALHYRNDSYGEYMYHEAWYKSRLMDNPLGVQFNKNTDNKIQSEELEAAFLWVQKCHEKEIQKAEGPSGSGHKEIIRNMESKYNKIEKSNKQYHNIFTKQTFKQTFYNWKESIITEEYKQKMLKKKILLEEEEEDEEEGEGEEEEEEEVEEDEEDEDENHILVETESINTTTLSEPAPAPAPAPAPEAPESLEDEQKEPEEFHDTLSAPPEAVSCPTEPTLDDTKLINQILSKYCNSPEEMKEYMTTTHHYTLE